MMTNSARDYVALRYGQWTQQFPDKLYKRWSDTCYWRVQKWLPGSRRAECLDLGCGVGNVLYMLHERGFTQLEGVDIHADPQAVHPEVRVHFRCGCALDHLRNTQKAYALITAFDILEHVGAAKGYEMLRLASERLAKGGTLLIQTPNGASPFGGACFYDDVTHNTLYTPNELARRMHQTGLVDVEATECGPVPITAKGRIRHLVWQILSFGADCWTAAETGVVTRGIHTRVFLIAGRKP